MTTKTKLKTKTKRAASKTAAPPKKRLTKAEKLKREIARRNRVFQKATAAEKRVLIAKDVIAQIKAGRYEPVTSTWVELNDKDGFMIDIVDDFGRDASIRELFLSEKIDNCECCALGAMFMSCTLYNNKTSVEQFDDQIVFGSFDWLVEQRGRLTNGLNTFFSPEQLMLIEIVFEKGMGAFDATDAEFNTAVNWREQYPEPEARMTAIMENIIKNKGTFKP